jgi:glutathione S-transferase
MITVHHLNSSRSQRVLWLLEELELPYEIKRYTRDPKTMLAPPELRAVHSLGKSPVITDDARVIAESGAILEYLVERYGNGRMIPAQGTDDRLRYTYWMHYGEGSLMPLMVMTLVFEQIQEAPMPFMLKPVAKGMVASVHKAFLGPQSLLHANYVESELGKSSWFAGEQLTAADVQMSFPLEAVLARSGIDKKKCPRITHFLERIHARPAYERAKRKVGDFMTSAV